MKNNNKNRKLDFIRGKNKLRLGKQVFRHYLKHVPNVTVSRIEKELLTAKNLLFEKYKLKLRYTFLAISEVNEDFINNTKTIQITLTNRR